ncbi:hypothetical protein B0T20DRAFT_200899 [Sordaria brevicollis]|uniref:Uncharacterized protein n=1 Tax=Sordaria brevicollis TaxID=83679 RepID=A0AAE0PDW0_SORBR|nr:hypothetical protein B0T20DRAFT_200899 [Sordaria brevicollis]
MMLQSFIVVSGLLASLAYGAPATALAIELVPNPHTAINNPVDVDIANNSTLVARGGGHDAKVYAGRGCSGDVVLQRNDWGCSGECISLTKEAQSINLHQDNSKNPKPTGNMYTGSSCTGANYHVGIWANYLDGCTDAPNGVVWRSMRLWFNC